MNSPSPFGRLDHVAIVVPDTDAAVAIWRDLVGLDYLFSEVVQDGAVRLTHLDLGNTELQLVEPLLPDHPLFGWIKQHGICLHHLCFEIEDIDAAFSEDSNLPLVPAQDLPHQATKNRLALFLDNTDTSVVIELISKA